MPEPSASKPVSSNPTVLIYSTPACPYCQMAKDFLKKYQIDYQELDVSRNEQAYQEMVQKSGQMGVPVLEINGTIVIGFNRRALAELLNIPLT